jgi:hypothetical protein
LSTRIQELEAQLALLRALEALGRTIALVIGDQVVFTSIELWRHAAVHPELRQALAAAGIQSPKQLGKRLKQLGLVRVSQDGSGVLWSCR